MKYDFVIVGAGFSGCILAERIANVLDKKVLIIEKRSHIAGNAFDYADENGILIHKYGPHIFHTQNKLLWDYLSKFTDWTEYYHKVLAVVEGKKVPVPFNLNSLDMLFPEKFAEKMSEKLTTNFGYGVKIPILKLRENKDTDLKFLADYIYENVFYGYTVKQWNLKPEELDFSVTSRIPVFISRDDRYFQDRYQALPSNGYTAMFEKIVASKNIHILLNADYKQIIDNIQFDKMIYTGPIDYFFDFSEGRLPYRSLEFDLKTLSADFYQETAQINYPNNHDFTRITEFKHFLNRKSDKTAIAFEYPKEYQEGVNDPYYPIPRAENQELFDKYKKLADALAGKVYFVGRLAEYKYYNMDQVAGIALLTFEKKIAKS